MAEVGKSEFRYTSRYRYAVDDKRRLQVPAKWRNEQELAEFLLVRLPHGWQKDAYLMAFPPDVAAELAAKLNTMLFTDPKAQAFRRFLGEKAETVTVDKAGRITLPEEMAKAVGIEDEAVLVGNFDRFQIWNPKRYEETAPETETLAAGIFQNF